MADFTLTEAQQKAGQVPAEKLAGAENQLWQIARTQYKFPEVKAEGNAVSGDDVLANNVDAFFGAKGAQIATKFASFDTFLDAMKSDPEHQKVVKAFADTHPNLKQGLLDYANKSTEVHALTNDLNNALTTAGASPETANAFSNHIIADVVDNDYSSKNKEAKYGKGFDAKVAVTPALKEKVTVEDTPATPAAAKHTVLTKPHASTKVAAWQEAMNEYEKDTGHADKVIAEDGRWGENTTKLFKELGGDVKSVMAKLHEKGITLHKGNFEVGAPAATPAQPAQPQQSAAK